MSDLIQAAVVFGVLGVSCWSIGYGPSWLASLWASFTSADFD